LSNANKTRRVQTRTLREEQIAGTFRNFLTSAYLNIFKVSSVSARSIHVDRISSTSYIKSRIFLLFVLSSNRIPDVARTSHRMLPTPCGSV